MACVIRWHESSLIRENHSGSDAEVAEGVTMPLSSSVPVLGPSRAGVERRNPAA